MPNISIQDPMSLAVKSLAISGVVQGIGGILDVTSFPNIQTITVNTPNVGLSGFNINAIVNTGIQTISLEKFQ
jgi:hypothetical protein